MSHPTESRTGFGFVRQYPSDLAIVTLFAVLADLLVTALPMGSDLRLAVALPLVLFLPGYALVAALFPAAARQARQHVTDETQLRPGGIDGIERVALSFALSLAISPLVAMGLAVTRWGLTPETASVALGLVTLVLAQLGAVRRLRVPDPDRFEFSLQRLLGRVRRSTDDGVIAAASMLLLAVSIVGAVSVLGFALVSPQAAGGFTELGVFTEDEDGELVADDYPSELEPGESASLVLQIENGEGSAQDYTVVVQQQRLEDGSVAERTELDRLDATVADGETARLDHDVEPTAEEGSVRVVYLLYEGDAPDDPTIDNAEENVFVWFDIAGEAGESGGDGDGDE